MTPELFTVADADRYAPLAALADRPPLLTPTQTPTPHAWTSSRTGVWTAWAPNAAAESAPQLAVAVAAAVERTQEALDRFAEACVRREIPFRHIRTEALYRHICGRDGSAALAGRFAVAYPADRAECEELKRELAEQTVFELVGDAPSTPEPVLFPDGVHRVPPDESMLATLQPRPVPPTGHRLRLALATRPGHLSYLTSDPLGRTVYVKQAHRRRAEALDEERATLRALHEAAPGLCPRPLGRRAENGREYLLAEALPGFVLHQWVGTNIPLTDRSATPQDWAAYYRRAEDVLAQIQRSVEQLRALGYSNAAVEPTHIFVDRNDTIRLAGFRADGPSTSPGHLALSLISLSAYVAEWNPGVLPYIRSYLSDRAPVPETLWSAVATTTAATTTTATTTETTEPARPPAPDLDHDERAALTDLRDRVVTGILEAARDNHPESVFPTVTQAFETNTLSVAYGDAGVLHALRAAGARVPEQAVERLRRNALAQADELPPGLLTGLAGIAWVLADFGHVEEARRLLRTADRHPLTQSSATLAWGSAGVATAHLALHRHTGEDHHLDRACALTGFPDAYADLTPLLGPNDATGLWYGRTGLAHALQQVAAVTGDEARFKTGLDLLHAELERAVSLDGLGLVFPASDTDPRMLYYLYCGTAGFLSTAARYLAAPPDGRLDRRPDERLHAALAGLVAQCEMPYVAHVGLGKGVSGLGYALADCGRVLGHEPARAAAWRVARALFHHAIPDRQAISDHHATAGPPAVRFLGDQRLRTSCDLWSGSAGVLVFLSALLDPAPDPLFTVDSAA